MSVNLKRRTLILAKCLTAIILIEAIEMGASVEASVATTPPHVSRRKNPEQRELEKTHEIMRRAKAAEIQNFMDTESEPCENFYNYACGRWSKINPANKEVKTGIFNTLEKAYNRRAAYLFSKAKHSDEEEMERKVKYFYESCLNHNNSKENYLRKLESVMEEFGGMPALKGSKWQESKFNWLEVVAKILNKYAKQIIIGVEVSADLNNNQINRLYLGQLDDLISGNGTQYYLILQVVRRIELQKVLHMSPELAAKVAEEMVKFERRLAVGLMDPKEGLGMEDKTRLRLLEEMSESYSPAINFTEFVKIWLGYDYRLPVYEYGEGYLKNAQRVIEKTPKRVLANYIMWQFIQDFRLESEELEEKHRMKCVGRTKQFFYKYLDLMVFQHILRRNKNILDEVTAMWVELKESFGQLLQSQTSNWMSNSTREKAMLKLETMTFEINSYENEDFQAQFGDLVISTDNYFQNVVNTLRQRAAYFRERIKYPPKIKESAELSFTPIYTPEMNKVLIPVAFLQPNHLWNNEIYPAALKYATIGYILGHELSHGFDDTLRKYDENGNLSDWWDRNSTEAFDLRKDCLLKQYSEYKYEDMFVGKYNAQGENIADNVGVRLAYAAYDKWLQNKQNEPAIPKERFPSLNLTPRQLFFVGTAQVWCADITAYLRYLVMKTDVHAPEEVRVNAMLSNFDAFALDFKCSLGSSMHPVRKCVFY